MTDILAETSGGLSDISRIEDSRSEPVGRDAGFTLVELLVGLALASMIASMIAVSIAQIRPLQRVEKRYEAQLIVDNLTKVVADDIRRARSIPLLEFSQEGPRPMNGSADTIHFVGAVATGFKAFGLREVQYALVEQAHEKAKKLTRSLKLRRFGQDIAGSPTQTDDLFGPVDRLEFSYMQRDETGVIAWGNSWMETGLPAAVRITLTIYIDSVAVRSRSTVRFTQ